MHAFGRLVLGIGIVVSAAGFGPLWPALGQEASNARIGATTNDHDRESGVVLFEVQGKAIGSRRYNAAFHVGEGLFVTCYHGLSGGEKYEIVSGSGERSRVTEVTAYERAMDIAVFRVERLPQDVGTLRLSRATKRAENTATWIGCAPGAVRSATAPILGEWDIPGWGRLLVIDGAVGLGDSGGPVIGTSGEVIGMVLGGKVQRLSAPEVGVWLHAIAVADIERVVSRARQSSSEAQHRVDLERIPIDKWVRQNLDPWVSLPDRVRRLQWDNQFDRAEAYLRALLQDSPLDSRGWALLAETRRLKGDVAGAKIAALSAVLADSMEPRALYELGKALEGSGRRADAREAYSQCVKAQKEGMTYYELLVIGDAHRRLASIAITEAQQEQGIVALRAALKIAPYIASDWVRMGDSLIVLGNHAEALAAYRHGLRLRPLSAPMMVRMAIAEMLTGQCAEAMETARRAVEVDGESPIARFVLGYMGVRQGDWKCAELQLEVLLARDAELATKLKSYLRGQAIERPRFRFGYDGGLSVEP